MSRPPDNDPLAANATALLLAVLPAILLVYAIPYLRGAEPVGDDSSSRIAAIACIAWHTIEGSPGWWMPDLNVGFPEACQPQSLDSCRLVLKNPKEECA